MGVTSVQIVAADNGGAAIQVTVTVSIVSANIGLFDGSGKSLQRVRSVPTASDGTLTLPVERTADITTDGSTPAVTSTTIQVGDQIYSGLTIPSSGSPVTLASLVPSHTDYTVAVTLGVDDPSEVAVAGLVARAYLSADSINLAGRLILATQPIPATADSMGNLTFHLDRTDQLTPVSIAGEPYYRVVVGSSTFYKKIHGAGTMASQPTATPATGNGSVSADQTGFAADSAVLTGSYSVPPLNLEEQLRQLSQIQARHVTAATYTVTTDDDVIDADGTSNAVAITLPSAAGWAKLVAVKTINIAHAVTITSASALEGGGFPLTPTLNIIYVFYSDGAIWRVYATNGAGGGGGVTSVNLALPAAIFANDGTPVTGSGNLTDSLATQTANKVLASPNGSTGTPSFRALVGADLPAATSSTPGAVKPDNTTTTVFGDVISAIGGIAAIAWALKTADYTVTPTDTAILVDATTGSITITLLSAVGITQAFRIKRKDGTPGYAVFIVTTSGQTINGPPRWVLSAKNQEIVCVSDQSNWEG